MKKQSILGAALLAAACWAGLNAVTFRACAQENPPERPSDTSKLPAADQPTQGEQPQQRPSPQAATQPQPDRTPAATGQRGGRQLGAGGSAPQGPGGFGQMQQDRKLVKQFDKDGDKRLNADERKAAREFLQNERTQNRGPGGRGGFGFGVGMMLAPQIVSQADKDGDSKLTKEEFVALADKWFDKIDTDAAGKLTQERFVEKFAEVLPPPQGFGGRGRAPDGGNLPPPSESGANNAPSPDSNQSTPGQGRPDGFGRGGGRAGGRGFGPGGFGPASFVGPGLFTAADADKDGSLLRTELKATFEKWFADWDSEKSGSLAEAKVREGLDAVLPRPTFGGGRGPGGPGGRGRGGNQEVPQPGPKLAPTDVATFPNAPLYDRQTVRTFFLEFENPDWEKELADFYHTDVEVPAKLTVDGKTYRHVGVHFRGTSSYIMAGEGRKRSLNLSLDFVHQKQQLSGYHTLNFLNSQSDPTFLRSVLYNHIARELIPAPKINYVRVVINGESWGVYVNSQQFDRDFTKDWFGAGKVARWKMPGNGRGTARFNYLGEDVAEYKRVYDIKTKDDPEAWAALIKLCRTLNQTPPDKLEEAISPLLDIDGILKYLALDNTLINSDGYWVLTGDYNICQDDKGRFHIVPHDANETFNPPNGPGFGGGGPGGGFGGGFGVRGPGLRVEGVKLDPLAGIDDPDKPLLNKLLAVPSLRTRYLGYVRLIAENWLDWNKLGPIAEQYQSLIAADVKTDTRKLYPFEAFTKGIIEDIAGEGFRGPSRTMSLKRFADERRAFLLSYSEPGANSIAK